MSRFFTSDWHLNSTLINQYAHRPWLTDIANVDNLVKNCNEVASSKSDVVFHVGDFILIGKDRHGRDVDVQYLQNDVDSYRSMLKANVVLLDGNHDTGHNCEADLKSMVVDLNQNYRNVYVSHFPSYHKDYDGPAGNPRKAPRIALCGHVHDKWILNYDKQHHVLNVNVGVDVWNYKPVRDSEITELLDYFKATMWTKINPRHEVFTDFALTRDALEKFKISHSKEMKEIRARRKQEKLKKKGLTPEDCERRRIEAMKAKGLIA